MNPIDIFILIFVLFFFIRGFFHGFILELTTLIGLVLGYLVAISNVGFVTSFILNIIPDLPHSAVNIFSFAILFIGTNLILRFLAGIITKTLKFAMLGWLNRWLGAVFGVVKSMIILSILVLVIDFLPFSEQIMANTNVQESQLYPILDVVGPELYRYLNNVSTML